MFKNRYRVVSKSNRHWEAQVMFWWFPLVWWQMHQYPLIGNLFFTEKDAENFIREKVNFKSSVKEIK